MGARDQYLALLAEDGRRVANRFAFASLPKTERLTQPLSVFYSMYGNESNLPEDERSRPRNPANAFDPCGWFSFYARRAHPWAATARSIAPNTDWPTVLAESAADQVRYLAALIHSEEAREQADEVTQAFLDALNSDDVVAIFVLLHRHFPQLAVPGERDIAEAFINLMREER